MATARVSFVTAPSTDSAPGEPSEPNATLDDTAHLVTRERLTVGGEALVRTLWFEIFLATLDEASQSPRKVTVRQTRIHLSSTLDIAKFIHVWKDLKHPNVLGLLGYTLKHENEIDLLISPYLINRYIRDFLDQAPVAVAQRLGFVRDVAAGLDYLHSQDPSVCHGSLDPSRILIDENFNAVLIDFELNRLYPGLWSEFRYISPEKVLGEPTTVASDVWAWGCVALEILTDKLPFDGGAGDSQVLSSIFQRKAPGQPDMLLSLVSGLWVQLRALEAVDGFRAR